jgi:hypothetical protein
MAHSWALCAVHSVDPETGRVGTNSTSNLCAKCKRDPANADWVEDDARLSGGFELDAMEAGAQDIQLPGKTRFDSPAARIALRSIAEGKTIAESAAAAGLSIDRVKKISAFWRKAVELRIKGIAKQGK